MAELRITASPQFPEGASLRAYPVAWWAGLPPRSGDTPRSAPFGGPAFVDSHGFATFDGLELGTSYYIGAQVAGIWEWRDARTETGAGTISVGAEAEIAAERAAREAADTAETAARIAADLLKAPLASPALTGVPKAPTAAPGANSTQVATTAYTDAAVATGGGLNDSQVKGKIATGPYAGAVLLAGTVGPTTTSGNYTPNLSGFARVFKVKASGAVAYQLPSNFPAGGGFRVYIELETEGNKAITYPFLAGWREGVEPEQDLSSPSSVNTIQAYSDDGLTWYGVGSEGLPTTLVQIATPVNTQTVVWNSTTKKWEAAAVGVSQAEVDTRIDLRAITTIGFPMALHAVGGIPVGSVPFTTTGTEGEWADLKTKIVEQALRRLSVHAPLAANASLEYDIFYPVEKAGVKLLMPFSSPPSGVAFQPGSLVIIENGSSGAIKLEGRFTPGSATVTTVELTDPVTVVYVIDAESVWRPVASYRSRAALEALIAPGAWAALSGVLGAKVEEAAGYRAAAARVEQVGSNVLLRGALKIKAASTLEAGDRLCTLPANKRPTGGEARLTLSGADFNVAEDGKVVLATANIAAATILGLDGKGFPIA